MMFVHRHEYLRFEPAAIFDIYDYLSMFQSSFGQYVDRLPFLRVFQDND